MSDAFVSEQDRVIIYGDLARCVIHGWPEDAEDPDDTKAFNAAFDVFNNRIMADPNESFYQGIEFMAVIERKSDGRRFGFQYWEDISKHGEAYIESNGSDYGIEYRVTNYGDYEPGYVFLPVEEFMVIGYKIAEKESNE